LPCHPGKLTLSTIEHHTGFTGSRRGLTKIQRKALHQVMEPLTGWWHHGDCRGGDAESHKIALSLGLLVELHPPANPNYRARCEGATIVRPVTDFLERNHDIVDATERLIAAPFEMKEMLRAGTWATVRYGRSLGRPITLIFPDGTTTESV